MKGKKEGESIVLQGEQKTEAGVGHTGQGQHEHEGQLGFPLIPASWPPPYRQSLLWALELANMGFPRKLCESDSVFVQSECPRCLQLVCYVHF